MSDFAQSLHSLGLNEKEADIYLAVLQAGTISLSDIGRTTRIRRTTVYQHLATLLKQGFISKTIKGKRVQYTPENPKKIFDSFDRARAVFAQQAPHLESLYQNARHQPSVRLYEGVEGIVRILEEIGSSLLTIDAFFSPEKFFRVVPKKDSSAFLLAIEKNENILRDLVEQDVTSAQFITEVRKTQDAFHKVKLLPEDFKVAIDVLVTGNKVAMISFDHLVGIIIENDEVAQFHRSTHNFFWKNLK